MFSGAGFSFNVKVVCFGLLCEAVEGFIVVELFGQRQHVISCNGCHGFEWQLVNCGQQIEGFCAEPE